MLVTPARLAVAFASLGLASPAFADPAPGVTVSEVRAFHATNALAAPRPLRLSAISGSVSITPSTDGKLDVTAVVERGDASLVRVVTRDDANGVAICVLFAEQSPNDCGASDTRAQARGDHHDSPTVSLVAHVPAAISVSASSLNGAIHAEGLAGSLRATTMNGDVHVSAAAISEASTLNGDIIATFAQAPAGHVKLSTNNGDVKASFASTLDADVTASTMHGDIVASFPIAISSTPGGFGPKSGRARVGRGGAEVQASTMNGNIELHETK
jgi:DUF4097 and DUF4098 domain-containing protein YvlB